MEADVMIKEHASEVWSISRLVARDEVTHLGEAIDEYKEGVVTIRDRKVGDEIASDSFPWVGGDRKWHQFSVFEVARRFTTGANIAG
jgi:hypothetical protein